ncbi:MAG: RNase adapter RapZ [Bacteroidales bacterium]|nr:RNase adapter RapZ [Bacteroidales bacterium]HOI31341.1 RNase adapter RapZ [Bacteroidales bacterium]
MVDLLTLKKQLETLFREHVGTLPQEIHPLPESGSGRLYYRLQNKKTSLIGVWNEQKDENQAFVYLSEMLTKIGFPVPKVFTLSTDKQTYLQEDLGTTSLFALVQQSLAQGEFHPSLLDFYKDAVNDLIRFQLKGSEAVDFSKTFSTTAFDQKAILADLHYFYYYFVKLHPQLHYNEFKLQHDMETFASYLAGEPANFLMYRDFQSRNIMIHEGKNYYIDFQGARRGPLAYDLVSLLYQVKAQLPESYRALLINQYLNELKKYKPQLVASFEQHFPGFVLLRLSQVLGAYGFRGLIQKKSHFLESIPFALNSLSKQLNKLNTDLEIDELKSVWKQLDLLTAKYPLPQKQAFSSLNIKVSSFSYKKGGIPDDPDGNGGGFVFDCRFLPNPGREIQYKMLTGRDEAVKSFLASKKEVQDFLETTEHLLTKAIQNYQSRRFSNLMISFGCTGGQHRSVFCAEEISQRLRTKYPDLVVSCIHHEQAFENE